MIGSGPAGQRAAVQAAKLGKRVAIIERGNMVGGVCVNTGTIPSKTMREAVIYLTGHSQRDMYGQSYRLKDDVSIGDLVWRTEQVVKQEVDVIRDQLARNHIELVCGTASFVDAHTLSVLDDDGSERRLTGEIVVIDGTRELVGAPRGAVRLARTLRRLDLTAQMRRVREAGIPTVVVGCTTDTLVTPRQCRSVAGLLGAEYRELALAGGHVWMLQRPALLVTVIEDSFSR